MTKSTSRKHALRCGPATPVVSRDPLPSPLAPGLEGGRMRGQHTPGRTSVSLLVHHVGTGDTPSTPSCSWCLSFVVPGPHRVSRRGECCGGACDPPHWSCDDSGRPGHVPWTGLTSQRTPQLSCECRVEVCVTRSGRGPPAHTVSCLPSLLPEQSPSKWYWKLVPVSDLAHPLHPDGHPVAVTRFH